MPDEAETQKRMRAARHFADYRNMSDLEEAIKREGLSRNLGEKTLRAIEQGHRPADAKDLYAIAAACGLPLAWFTADFSRLEEISDDPRAVIAQRLAEAAARAEARRASKPGGRRSRPAEGRER